MTDVVILKWAWSPILLHPIVHLGMILGVGKVQKGYIRQLQPMTWHLPMELLQRQLILLKSDKNIFPRQLSLQSDSIAWKTTLAEPSSSKHINLCYLINKEASVYHRMHSKKVKRVGLTCSSLYLLMKNCVIKGILKYILSNTYLTSYVFSFSKTGGLKKIKL